MPDIPKTSRGWDAHNSHTDLIRAKWDHCERIAEEARRQGLNATTEMVSRNYTRFRQWSEGKLATGYLMRLTGVQSIRKAR